jgi:hypothetical protein
MELRIAGAEGPRTVAIEVDLARVAAVMSRPSSCGELRAGDVVLLPAPGWQTARVGAWVEVESVALGRLRGRLG